MAQKILIDLEKFRTAAGKPGDEAPPEGIYASLANHSGLKSIREWAVFRYSCRRCTDAPCISVCPAEALEKDAEGCISRAVNLCVACKSCVVVCPFGTMMSDFFEYHRNKDNYYDLADKNELELLIRDSPEGAVSLVEMEADPENNIYSLGDHILVKEQKWKSNSW
jgi:Fe-S-cluster-containing hydrogenase component 2